MVCVLTIKDPRPKGRGREAGGGIWNHWNLGFQLPTKACSAVNRRMTGWMNWLSGWMEDCIRLHHSSFGPTPFPWPLSVRLKNPEPMSPAGRTTGRIQGKPTKRMDLREASFSRFHSCFTICNKGSLGKNWEITYSKG
jgi:hypothetical protein